MKGVSEIWCLFWVPVCEWNRGFGGGHGFRESLPINRASGAGSPGIEGLSGVCYRIFFDEL